MQYLQSNQEACHSPGEGQNRPVDTRFGHYIVVTLKQPRIGSTIAGTLDTATPIAETLTTATPSGQTLATATPIAGTLTAAIPITETRTTSTSETRRHQPSGHKPQ